MAHQVKAFPLSEFKQNEESPGRFRALVAVFNNVDDGGDRVLPGAFKKTLKQNPRPPIVWSHAWDIPPIGQTLSAKETEAGLEIEGQLLLEDDGISGQYARSVHAGMKAGVLKEFSFAFEVSDSAEVKEKGQTVRELKALDIFEVGPTLIGMNRETQLLEVAGHTKNALDELADKLAERIFAKQNPSYSINTAGSNATMITDVHLANQKPIKPIEAPEAAAPSPAEDEQRAAQLAEINRLKQLIPR